MTDFIKKLYKKYRELIIYGVFGVLATVVDFGSYLILTRLLNADEHFSNVAAQIIAMIFAFFTNKFYVFGDKDCKAKHVLIQFLEFISLRIVTIIINSAMFSFMIEMFNLNDILTKTFVAVVVIILNYVFSKLIVFKKKEDK